VLLTRRGLIVDGVDANRTTLVEIFARPGRLNSALIAAFALRRDL
jgi:hypothetical protein